MDKKTKKIIKRFYKKLSKNESINKNYIQNNFYEADNYIASIKNILEQHIALNFNFKKCFLNSKKEFVFPKNGNRISKLLEINQTIQNNIYSTQRVTEQLQYVRADLIDKIYSYQDKKFDSKNISNVVIELSSLEEIYGKKFEFEESCVNVTSEDVTLKDTNDKNWKLGNFTIKLPFETIFNDSDDWHQRYNIVANKPNICASDDSITHPHVKNEWLCEGEARAAIAGALRQGRLVDFFDMVMGILNTYGHSNPYAKLEEWDVTETCCECGNHVYEDTRSICGCDSVLCEDCGSCCSYCDCIVCSECNHYCEQCETQVCESCQERCSSCRSYYCPDCITKCDSCGYRYCKECGETCHECGDTCCPNCSDTCSDCNKTFCPECHCSCTDCGEATCGNCAKECRCGDTFCKSCSKECYDCNEIVCDACSSGCKKCSEKYCEDCLEEGICSNCREDVTELSTETSEEEIKNDSTSTT